MNLKGKNFDEYWKAIVKQTIFAGESSLDVRFWSNLFKFTSYAPNRVIMTVWTGSIIE